MTEVIYLDVSESPETRNRLTTEIKFFCSDVPGDKRPWVISGLLS
jgi:hypothetical protein